MNDAGERRVISFHENWRFMRLTQKNGLAGLAFVEVR